SLRLRVVCTISYHGRAAGLALSIRSDPLIAFDRVGCRGFKARPPTNMTPAAGPCAATSGRRTTVAGRGDCAPPRLSALGPRSTVSALRPPPFVLRPLLSSVARP